MKDGSEKEKMMISEKTKQRAKDIRERIVSGADLWLIGSDIERLQEDLAFTGEMGNSVTLEHDIELADELMDDLNDAFEKQGTHEPLRNW